MNNPKNNYEKTFIKIGVVGKPFGLKGYFFVSKRKQHIPLSYEELIIGDLYSGLKVKILESKIHTKRPLLLCTHFYSKTDVTNFIGQDIWVSADKLSPDELLYYELCGKTVIDINNMIIGKIIAIKNFGASNILQIQQNNKCVDIPLVDQYVHTDQLNHTEIKLKIDKCLFEEFWYQYKKND